MAATRRALQLDDIEIGDRVVIEYVPHGCSGTEYARGVYEGLRRFVDHGRVYWFIAVATGRNDADWIWSRSIKRIRRF